MPRATFILLVHNAEETNPLFVGQLFGRIIRAAGIAPVVTLLHFDVPYALVERYGAFADRRAVDAFERYCCLCFERFGDRVKYWITVNEQNVNVRAITRTAVDAASTPACRRRSSVTLPPWWRPREVPDTTPWPTSSHVGALGVGFRLRTSACSFG